MRVRFIIRRVIWVVVGWLESARRVSGMGRRRKVAVAMGWGVRVSVSFPVVIGMG